MLAAALCVPIAFLTSNEQSAEQAHCGYANLDYGGSNVGCPACGYSQTLGIVRQSDDAPPCDAAGGDCIDGTWLGEDGLYVPVLGVDERAQTWQGCQDVCRETDGCAYYSHYMVAATGYGECYLKAAYQHCEAEQQYAIDIRARATAFSGPAICD